MSRYKLRLTLTLSLSVLILGYWGFREPHHPVMPPADGRLQEEVDGYLIGARMVEFDPQGQPSRTLIASRIDHYPQQAQTRLSAPDITVMREDASPVRITAARGRILHENNEIELLENVLVADLETPRYRLETPYLTLYPDRDYAETDAPVHIHHLSGDTQGIGMRLFLDQDRVQLLQSVRGTHEPN